MKYNNKRRLFLLPFFEVAKCTKWWRKTNATNKYTNVATPLNLQPTTHTERLVALSQQFKIRKKNSRKILVLHKLHSLSIIITIKWIRASNKKRWHLAHKLCVFALSFNGFHLFQLETWTMAMQKMRKENIIIWIKRVHCIFSCLEQSKRKHILSVSQEKETTKKTQPLQLENK